MAENGAPLLDDWRQGDFTLAPMELPVLLLDEGEPVFGYADAPRGVVLLSQTCDVIRDVADKPFVQIAILTAVDADEMLRIKAKHAPGRVYLAALEAQGLAVDLEHVATVHKDLVATWDRTAGCPSDSEQRDFAAALARHRHRFAFPDNFNDLIRPVRRWIEGKRKSNSAHGEFVQALSEIRVQVDDWSNPSELVFLAIVQQQPSDDDRKRWEPTISTLATKAQHADYPAAEFRITTIDDMSASDYLRSDRLDWDGLSDA